MIQIFWKKILVQQIIALAGFYLIVYFKISFYGVLIFNKIHHFYF